MFGFNKRPFKIGDCVRVKEGVVDADFPDESLAGFQGRVLALEKSGKGVFMVDIAWDSVTLRNIPLHNICTAEEQDLDWSRHTLFATELDIAKARDSEEDVKAAYDEVYDNFRRSLVTRPTENGMEFDIFALDEKDFDDSVLEIYIDLFVENFINSPEAQALKEQLSDPDIGGWTGNFINFTFNYAETEVSKLTPGDVKSLLENHFPRKISILDPKDADKVIPELIAFWKFLKRQYNLSNANKILTYLAKIKPKYHAIMNDKSKFSVAKSVIMQGIEAGYDISTPEGMDAFIHKYNQTLQQSGALNLRSLYASSYPYDDESSGSGAARAYHSAERRKKRKQAKASKRKNRKRK